MRRDLLTLPSLGIYLHKQTPMIELPTKERRLTVGLLAASAGARTTELLRLAAARVGDQQGAIVRHKDVLDLPLGGLVNVLLVVSHNRLGDRLPGKAR